MKSVAMFLVAAGLFLAGCKYEAPFTTEHSIPVDSSVLGLWEPVPEKGGESFKDERMMILKYSDTEYLIHYPVEEDGLYFRGYAIKIRDISCVQLQVIGNEDGPLKRDKKDIFHVASYLVENGELHVKMLNTELVSDELTESEALKKAFLKHKDDKNLFANPGRFRRVKD
jgi:hypothetical protein